MGKYLTYFMPLIITIISVVLIDMYTLRGIRHVLNELSINITGLRYIHWGLSVFFIICFLGAYFYILTTERNPWAYKYFFSMTGLFILLYLPKIIFSTTLIFDDIILLFKSIITSGASFRPYISYGGAALLIITTIIILHGILLGRHKFTVRETNIKADVHEAFNGFKIVQLSDIHIGSFLGNKRQVEKAVAMVNELEPDIIVITGDLVNNFYEELPQFESILSSLTAKYGKYSVLGNHDYGDYYNWPSQELKDLNLNKIIEAYDKMGFKLLINESEKITINNESISILGVENWGLPPFHQYGDLQKALIDTRSEDFKILLSHDPTHWDIKVKNKTNINLTLSGHTHGAQSGIETKWFKWSPVSFKYKKWGGLYEENGQYLYINRGLGYIGFPGRVGIWPEITLITLNE